MNDELHTPDQHPESEGRRPIGLWVTAVDRLLHREFARAFGELGIGRREWRVLNQIAGTVDDPRLAEKLAARPHVVRPLVERGWVTGADDGWTVTDDGRAAIDEMEERVRGIRARIADAVGDDEYETTVASLEKIARALGWSDEPADDEHDREHDREHGPEGARGGWRGFRRGGWRFGPRPGGWHGDPAAGRYGTADAGRHGHPAEWHGRAGWDGPAGWHGHAPWHGPAFGARPGRDDVHVHIHVHGGGRRRRPAGTTSREV